MIHTHSKFLLVFVFKILATFYNISYVVETIFKLFTIPWFTSIYRSKYLTYNNTIFNINYIDTIVKIDIYYMQCFTYIVVLYVKHSNKYRMYKLPVIITLQAYHSHPNLPNTYKTRHKSRKH